MEDERYVGVAFCPCSSKRPTYRRSIPQTVSLCTMFRCSALHDTSIRGAAAASRRSQVPSGPLVRVSSLRRSYRRAGTHLCRARENETKEEALQRRLRESDRVEERLIGVHTEDELRVQLEQAGDKLVVLEIMSADVCMTGFDEEPELHWKADKQASLEPCRQLRHVFLRTARDCPDVIFLQLSADDEQGEVLCDQLGIDVLPTLRFYRQGKLLWEHRGHSAMDKDLGEGVLYFGDTAGNGVKASTFVTELHSRADFEKFLMQQDEKVLTVVDVSLTSATPCVHIFPAVLALAKNFQGYAAFARMMGDESQDMQQLMAEHNIIQVPTFLFFRNGKEVGRHVGSSRGDLIGQILQLQAALGIAPPAPPTQGGTPRKQAAAAARPKRSRW